MNPASSFNDESNAVTLLSRAVRKADFEEVIDLVEKGAPVDQTEPGEATPLLLALYLNLFEIAKYLISKGASVNIGDSYETPLMVATRKSDLEIIKLLVQNGATIDDFNTHKTSPLFWAIKEQNLPVLEILLINYSQLGKVTSVNGDSPLIFALRNGSNPEIIKCLLNKGAEINKSSLTWVAKNGTAEIMDLLMENDYGPDFIDDDGNTLVAVAVRYKHPEMVKLLLDLGANVCEVGKTGKTPLLWAVLNQDLNMVELLLDRGAVFAADSVLLEALLMKNFPIVAKLYERGAFKSVKYKMNNKSLLEQALEVESCEIVKFLLENGATIADLGGKATDTLFKFIEKKNFEMVKLLTEAGTSLNKNNHAKFTPLTRAIENQDLEMVAYFIEKGANVNQIDPEKYTPLAQAMLNQDFRIFQYLVKSGANLENETKEKIDTTMIRFYEIAKANIEKENIQFKEQSSSNQEAEKLTNASKEEDIHTKANLRSQEKITKIGGI